MKICSLCNIEKPLADFNKNKVKKDGLQTFCRPCQHEKFKKYYAENKEHHLKVIRKRTDMRRTKARDLIVEYLKTHPCMDCGITDIRVLEFDHLPDSIKIDGVARLATGGYSLAVILAEIEKCEVRCRNCHMIKTYERLGGTWHDKYIMGA